MTDNISEHKSSKAANEKIVFFDGICAICNWSIDFLIKADRKKVLKFAPIQGQSANKILDDNEIESLENIIFLDCDKKHVKSDAVLEIMRSLGGIWKIGWVFKIVPRVIRDFVYDAIAKNRYKWFGKMDNCRVPTEEEKMRFLDESINN